MDRDYADCGVQTSPIVRTSASDSELALSNSPNGSVPRAYDDGCQSFSPNSTSNSTRSLSSLQPESAYSHSFIHHDSDSSGPVRSKAIARRQHLPYNRPRGPRKPELRGVSLPEIGSSPPSIKAVIEATTVRVISLAERPKPPVLNYSPSPIRFRSPTFKNSLFFTGSEDNSRSHNRTSTSDVPHTPSPPSSPESSVLIIENDAQLPRTFLRKKSTLDSHLEYSDDDGWITWASSPPRPIPALHGPLSLPYARCPSGAEGTIIEGPETLTGMIWGLGAEEPPAARPSANSGTLRLESPQKATAHLPSVNQPPRLQKIRSHPVHNLPLQSEGTLPPVARRLAPMNENDRRTQTALHQRALETLGLRHPPNVYSGAATLNHMLRTGAAEVTGPWTALDDLKNNKAQRCPTSDQAGIDINGGLGLDWQSVLAYQALNKNDGGTVKRDDYLKTSTPLFVPAGQVGQPQYPRIFIEPRSIPPSSNTSHRLSALEIAQQYQKQQQVQHSLPTPPSSSSPQWSPYFSAHQDSFSLHSAPVARPPISMLAQSQLGQRSTGDPSHELRRYVYERIGKLGQNAGGISNSRRLATPTKTPQVSRAFSQPASQRYPETSTALPKYLKYRNLLSSQSPNLHPGPPPNSPLPPIPSTENKQRFTPLSPTSPEPRSRSFSTQKPRSIPLARLIQRRLSSVPEEDINSVIELTHSPSTSSLKQKSGDIRSARGPVLSPLQVSANPQQLHTPPIKSQRTPSPVPVTLTPQSQFGAEGLPIGTHVAQVKLPHKQNHVGRNGLVSGPGKGRGRVVKNGRIGAESALESKENVIKGVEGSAPGKAPRKKGRKKRITGNAIPVVQG